MGRAGELGLVVLISSALLLLTAIYFSALDPRRGGASLTRAVDEAAVPVAVSTHAPKERQLEAART